MGMGKKLSICLLSIAHLKHRFEGQENRKCKTLYHLLTRPTTIETGVVTRATRLGKTTTIDNERQLNTTLCPKGGFIHKKISEILT